jgi:hypothetical protein
MNENNMINKINKERRRSINATLTGPSNKNQLQKDPKRKQVKYEVYGKVQFSNSAY